MSDSTDDRSSQTDTESHDDSRAAESDDDVSTAPATSGHSDAGSQAQRNQDDESPS